MEGGCPGESPPGIVQPAQGEPQDIGVMEIYMFRQDVLTFKEKSSPPPGLMPGCRKDLRRSIRHWNHLMLIHNGFVIRW